MLTRGVINAPLGNTIIKMEGGVVTIRQNATERQPLITVYMFAQPQPYYTLDDVTVTTDGSRYLHQLVMEATSAVRVNAGYNLLAALLISPEGLLLADLHPDVLVGRRDRGSNLQLHTLALMEPRFGLRKGSELRFREGWGNRVESESIDPDWGESYR